MKLNIINIISTYASTAAMQAGKAYKKITTEKLPEDGMIEQSMCLQILQQTVDSKTSKYKEQAADLIAQTKKGDPSKFTCRTNISSPTTSMGTLRRWPNPTYSSRVEPVLCNSVTIA